MESFRDILSKAQKGHYAIGQFNVSNLETLKAVLGAAERLNAPVIIGTSEGEREFFGRRQIVKLAEAYREEARIPIILNADHTKSFGEIKMVVKAGYEMVHFDGSKLPLEENIKQTRMAAEYIKKLKIPEADASHRYGAGKNKKSPQQSRLRRDATGQAKILIEGELGYLRGDSSLHGAVEIKPEDMTKPEEAARFVRETGVDSLAIVIGNVHGVVVGGNPRLDLNRLREIKKAIGDKFLVLHGGSGIAVEDIKEAIKIGIVKININTELRVSYTNTLRRVLRENPDEATPYKIFPAVIEAIKDVVENKIKLFRSK